MLTLRPHSDISIAVSTTTGLYPPTVRPVDTHSVYSLAVTLKHLAYLGRQMTANYSVALPLAVRSPYLSCWLPQINGTANATSHDAPSATASDLSQVSPFSKSNPAKHRDPFGGSRREICVSLSWRWQRLQHPWVSSLHIYRFDKAWRPFCEHHE